jgi:hypothetical protein
MRRILQLNRAGAVLVAGAIVFGGAQFAAAAPAVPAPWNNCTQVHTRYPPGVGKRVQGTECVVVRHPSRRSNAAPPSTTPR